MPKLYELLGTKKVKEQEQRVEQLLNMYQMPVMSVMVLFDPRVQRIDIRAAGLDQPGIGDIKFVLRTAVDELTAREVEQRRQQHAASITPPPDFIPNDENAPDDFIPDEIPDPSLDEPSFADDD